MTHSEKGPFLSVRNLEVIYTSGKKIVHAVNGISFDMKKGETLGLVGETGAGKTTIAKSILRVLPNPPAKVLGGEIFLDGKDLMTYPEKEMLRIRGGKVAMIFQDPMTALNPLMTIGGQIVEGLKLHNDFSDVEAVHKAKELLEMVGIHAERFNEYPFEFSGGMKQRVVIAMALACEPELLLADEPTTALDVTIQAQVLDLINKLKIKYGASMILITHNLGVVAQTCDRVGVIYAGKIIEYGSKKDIFVDFAHPYTQGLFASLPSFSKNSLRLKPIAGSMPDPTDLPQGCAFHPRCPFVIEKCRNDEIPLIEISSGHFCRCCNIQKKG
ncbi:MAG TPA: ABC transporter ATP-binding protein [Longilinea sp.]|nr:ABC transporter ATP-binding protein [Longilinea sp.]